MERAKPIRGGEAKRVCSPGRGVKGGLVEGESMTQLLRCERMRLVVDMVRVAVVVADMVG